MTERPRRGDRAAALWQQVITRIDGLAATLEKPRLDIVDIGGGSGVFAVPLAQLGHRVTVVDPSPNALATLERRAADARLSAPIAAVQGDAATVGSALGSAVADVVLCHGVLEVVDDPATAAAGLAMVLRPAGVASVVVAQRHAAVLARALSGHLAEAQHALDDPDGRWGASDPLPRRFDEPALTTLLATAGLRVDEVHGVRVFADLVPGELVDDAADVAALASLEAAAEQRPEFRAVAAALHVLALPA